MRRTASGFTLAEVLVAAAIITVGLVGTTAMLQLTAASSREGRQRSAANFLADERIEHIRSVVWDAVGDCLGISPSGALPPETSSCPHVGARHVLFPDEPAGTLRAPFETFTRTVRVEPCVSVDACGVASPELRLVTIMIGSGQEARRVVRLRGLVARRL